MDLKEKINRIIDELYEIDNYTENDDDAHEAIMEARMALSSYVDGK